MAVPRIARVHLLYQFIILFLLQVTFILTFFAIGYNEILPDKRYLFLALIPVFCYQLSIVFCSLELMPLPGWIMTETISSDTQETKTDFEKLSTTNEMIQTKSVELVVPRKRISFRNDLPSRKIDIANTVLSPCPESKSPKNRTSNAETGGPVFRPKLETTKSFSNCQKRVENWLESTKEAAHPYKVQNWKSHGYSNSKPVVITRSPSFKVDDHVEADGLIDKESDIMNISNDLTKDSSDLTKSYSYPFRLRNPGKLEDSNETLNSGFNIPSMPPWKALNYRISCERQRRKRKSISTEALDKELKHIRSQCQQDCQRDLEFSQSVELPKPADVEECPEKKTNLKHVSSFSKIKQGIVSCFNKGRRDSVKTDIDNNKENMENEKPFFKELFLSKENLMFDTEKKESVRQRNLTRAKSESRDKHSSTYVTFRDDNFGKCARSSCFGFGEFEKI